MRVQTIIANTKSVLSISPKCRIADDLDYLLAKLHGRRSRMAESERLDVLCRIRSLPEFFLAIFPESNIKGVVDFQRLLIDELVNEFSGFRTFISGPGGDFLDWTLVRFQVENLKVLIRACLTKTPLEEIKEHLISLPVDLFLSSQEWTKVESPEDFIRLIPKKVLQGKMEDALVIYHEYPQSFFFEVALDCSYYKELVARTEELLGEDRRIVRPIVHQEADIFNIMLAARGKFHYGLAPKILQPFYVPGTKISRTQFLSILNDADLSTSMGRVSDRLLDAELSQFGQKKGSNNVDTSALESLTWNRFFRLANQAFRQSHMGLAAIIGYMGLRRVEVSNLIKISEGIRMDMPAETIRGHMIPRINIEAEHV